MGDSIGSSVMSSSTVPWAELNVLSSSEAFITSSNRDSAKKSYFSLR